MQISTTANSSFIHTGKSVHICHRFIKLLGFWEQRNINCILYLAHSLNLFIHINSQGKIKENNCISHLNFSYHQKLWQYQEKRRPRNSQFYMNTERQIILSLNLHKLHLPKIFPCSFSSICKQSKWSPTLFIWCKILPFLGSVFTETES